MLSLLKIFANLLLLTYYSRCLSRNEELASNAQEKYNEWNDNFNDANDDLIDKHQHSVNYGEYLKANDLTKPVQKEVKLFIVTLVVILSVTPRSLEVLISFF